MDEKERMVEYYLSHPEYYSLLSEKQNREVDVDGRLIEKRIRQRCSNRIAPIDYHILDVACGSGNMLINLTGRLLKLKAGLYEDINPVCLGVDVSPHATKLANDQNPHKTNCTFATWDAEKPFPIEKYKSEMVYSTYSLEHIPNPTRFLDNIISATENTGDIYLAFPGLFSCFGNPFNRNSVPVRDRLLKLYDALRMLLDKKYIRFRFVSPSLDGVEGHPDMVFLTFTPEIVRYLEQNGCRVVDYDVRGRVVAMKGEKPKEDWLRPVKYLLQSLAFLTSLVIGKLGGKHVGGR